MDRTPSLTTLREQERDFEKEELEIPQRPDEPTEEKEDEGESGEPGPLKSVGFFHHSLFHVRNHVIRLWIRTVLTLSIFILAVLSIYWGALFRVNKNLHALHIFVVDFRCPGHSIQFV